MAGKVFDHVPHDQQVKPFQKGGGAFWNHWVPGELGGQVLQSGEGLWLPLYEGKTITVFNHRYAHTESNADNQSGQGVSVKLTPAELVDPNVSARPRYWVSEKDIPDQGFDWVFGFNDVCNTNNYRSLIGAIVGRAGYGNKLPILVPTDPDKIDRSELLLMTANFCAIPTDYLARLKIQARNLNKYMLEQLPMVQPARFHTVRFGSKTAADVIKPAVIELSYTAHDMASFALDMGLVDASGKVLPPFAWDEARRLRLRAKLDAVFFHLYGIFDASNRAQSRDDITYIYSTFPIVERQEIEAHGRYLSRDLALAYCNTLAAGHPDAEPEV